ncbi:hypothetical protein MKP08_03415 [Erythrobacter sp. LQ02-29]|uniref:hypothetical protein n=1 Tax=Erythrobacter sp. LQ02-29 TaxID=2920384 RepID=UPI001F4D8836|nr:hypothetical protein [Erythrobacter sp. LQ02-29]MCP9221794.1 hypothetical protein [Erythrobacter sp. LQ02-29]
MMTASALRFATALALPLAGATMLPATAAAQDDPGDKVNMVIVYGEDACPPSSDGEIVVCARKPDSERYRIPDDLRYSDDPANTSWTRTVESMEMVGAFGIDSCSPVGAGGITGCTKQLIDRAYGEKANSSSIRFGRLIDEARAERLSTIDEEAAAEQERVEMIEREYMQRLERERDAETTGNAAVDASAPPAINQARRQPPVVPSKETQFDDGEEGQRPATEPSLGDPTVPSDPG